ncbi:formaldehyde-activating enzyme [Saccharopolyspora sp. NFXS83]|uniref:formaldehyde-activating enzyme n=1 Tax=Saccharopolyspora sp. NFXS83 TaxID=2993560 RepID=UPI00224B9767|nr:formaldehyde-activating enzyme [Saccharopolyspora sp. NFXS83]MCX2729265.1 formaldehyde-activating enzyme [Saccharopolyspora sp. NFXS83]
MSTTRQLDGRIAQGWGGRTPNGCHVNVVLADRGSPTAAAMMTTYAAPAEGFTSILVSVGQDQPSDEAVHPPTLMVNKTRADPGLIAGACQVGIAQGVLDVVAAGTLVADQETLVFVSIRLGPDADDETAAKHSSREATRNAVGEATTGRDPAAVQRLFLARDRLAHPFYGGD